MGSCGRTCRDRQGLWRYARVANGTANIPTVVARDDRVCCSTGYGDGGSTLLQLKAVGKDRVVAAEVKYYDNTLQNHHGGWCWWATTCTSGPPRPGFPACVDFNTGEKQYKLAKPLGVTATLSLIEPAIMLFMGAFVTFVLVALYLPIFSLADTLK